MGDAYYVDPVGRSSGLAIWWNSATGLSILNGNKNLIIVEGTFSARVLSYPGFLCFVYAPHDAASRSPIWNAIIQKSSLNVPCFIVGDLNLIGSSKDKEGGYHICHIEKFQNFIASASILEVPYTGLYFTWSNQRCGEAFIRERIDRAFGNINLFELYPYHCLLHKPLIGSDQVPLIYCSQSSSSNKCYWFCFESMWTTHEDCETIVREAWLNLCTDNNLQTLKNNLSICARKLKQWSKCSLGNNRKLIDCYARELAVIQGLRSTPKTILREHQLLQDLEDHFMALFQSSGPRDLEEAVSALNPVVSQEINNKLQTRVSTEEIYRATKQLGGLKAPGEDGFSSIFYHKYWHLVGDSVCKAISYFFETGHMLPKIN
ncbi:reverse transcriptase [Artemisia annua]|uniref:Reverse transcriptase n=1 Tax=Artemisia annua TaxID=35608 RepID=A0A2U1NDQ3_ARTAN|nr:reverse transcriptase [Artemisia annua]